MSLLYALCFGWAGMSSDSAGFYGGICGSGCYVSGAEAAATVDAYMYGAVSA